MAYVNYFEQKVLPSKALSAPTGTRLQRIEVSLQLPVSVCHCQAVDIVLTASDTSHILNTHTTQLRRGLHAAYV